MSWQAHAACRDMDPEAFFPTVGKSNDSRDALDICGGCEVQKACDLYASHHKITNGVWGARLRQARGQAR